MKLSTAVKELRVHLGLSQTRLGEEIGVAHTTVVYWEQGKSIGPYNRMRLFDYAKKVEAPPAIVAAFEAAQPDGAR